MATDPGEGSTKQQSGRGHNPASINALSRKGKGRPSLPQSQSRSTRNVQVDNAAWNGLIDLAVSQDLSVSRLIERLAERASWLLEPVENWTLSDRLAQLHLTEAQALALPLLTILAQSFGSQAQSGQGSRSQKLTEPGSAKHHLRISPTGWEGLKTLAIGIRRSEPKTIELLGLHAELLRQPLAYWLKKPTESVLRQLVAVK